jgi:hypothetical protein
MHCGGTLGIYVLCTVFLTFVGTNQRQLNITGFSLLYNFLSTRLPDSKYSIGDHISAIKRIERQREKEVAIVAFSAGGRRLREIQTRRQQKTLGHLGLLGVCRRMNLVF